MFVTSSYQFQANYKMFWVRIIAASVATACLWAWLLDTFVFVNDNFFWTAFLIVVFGLPLANFLIKLVNTFVMPVLTRGALDNLIYDRWIDAKFPVVHTSTTKDYKVLDYLIAIQTWPEATREQSNWASFISGEYEATRSRGMIDAITANGSLERCYRRYMKDNRHRWESDKLFSAYLIGGLGADPNDLELDRSIEEIMQDYK